MGSKVNLMTSLKKLINEYFLGEKWNISKNRILINLKNIFYACKFFFEAIQKQIYELM